MLTLVAIILVFIVSALLLQKWSPPKAMDRIPGSLGWPVVGESFSFLSSFSSPSGIFSFSIYQEPIKPFSYLGFGSGPRMCPGINLAKLEICIFIHHLVCRYRWKPLEKDDSVQATLVRMPKNKYPVVVESL